MEEYWIKLKAPWLTLVPVWWLGVVAFITYLLGWVRGHLDCKENGGYLKGYNKAWNDIDDLLNQIEAARTGE